MNLHSAVLGIALLVLSSLRVWAQEGEEAHPSLLPVAGLILFYSGSGPLSYPTPTPRDVPPGALLLGEVRGEGCQQGLFVPIDLSLRPTSVSGVVGNAGYAKALQAIHQEHPALAGIFDVKIDLHVFSVLGIYRRLCTEVVAQGYRAKDGLGGR